jgi:hypothetical protein
MRRTSEQWGELLLTQQLSGLSMAAFCREQGIRQKSFYYWHRKLMKADVVLSDFIQVQMPVRTMSSRCVLKVGAAELAFSDAVSPAWLAQVLKALT